MINICAKVIFSGIYLNPLNTLSFPYMSSSQSLVNLIMQCKCINVSSLILLSSIL